MNRRAFLRRSSLLTGGALAGAGVLAGAAGSAAAEEYRVHTDVAMSGLAVGPARPAGLRGTSLTYRVDTDVPMVALTFDDGPSERFTPRVLDILERARVVATFFMIGSHASALPELARRVAQRHEIGNHTATHPDLSLARAAEATAQLAHAAEQIRIATGRAPTVFRPPYGRFSGASAMVAAGMQYPIVLWDLKFDVRSTAGSNVDRLAAAAGPGSIILGHDGGTLDNDVVAQALPGLIDRLRARGLRFATVSELLTARPGTAVSSSG
ncbi:MAG: polysaccharide deacetylase family protein [Actinomycetota bacterium]